MTLIKTSFLTSIATLIKIACYFVISKVSAFFLGPAGFAIIGQFQNFVQVVQAFAGGLIGHGVVKYVAEHRTHEEEKKAVLSTAFAMSIFGSILFGAILFTLRHFFAVEILLDPHYSLIMGILAFTLIFYVLNIFFADVMNGERDIARLTLCNVIANVIALILTIALVAKYKMMGALLVLVLSPVLVFFISGYFLIKSQWFNIKNFFAQPNKDYTYRLFQYGLLAVITAILSPLIQLFLRRYIIHDLSWQDAGYWDAINKISDGYLAFIVSTLSVYYLPKLSELSSNQLIFKEIISGYKTILPVTILLAFTIYLCREKIIYILFTPNFLPMMQLFEYQLLGDVLKIGSWLLSYILIARAMIKLSILTEILFSVSYVCLAIVCLHFYGLIGITMAFAINYGMYWLFMSGYVFLYLRKERI